ncbi:aldehyde dehydrogenase family protein [Fluviibacterium sp. S390]|uniref:aldehyde dehydrogenase family protein n=1 Tax=Fluviibacterium sp. S390 TaxID=3415139 RepID=UPI003C7A01CF
MTKLHTDRFYINGAWVAPQGRDTLPVINPATAQPIATVALGTAADVEAAVSAARAAFPGFARSTLAERLDLLAAIRAGYEARYDEMAEAISAEMGAPIDLSRRAQAQAGLGNLDGVVAAAKRFAFEEINPAGDLLRHEPIGVCALITPWNWPANQIALKVLPALAAGCTMVLKPSELTPLSALLFAEILDEAGVPAGVFNLINGDGPTVGAELSRHPNVDMVSFTGSTRAGVEVGRAAAATIKRVTLELGGKSPNILLDDVDLEKAVRRGVRQCFNNTGQSCNAPTRMLVPRALYAKAAEIAADTARTTMVGDPAQPGRHIGPLASDMQFDRVQAMIAKGIAEGATLLAGGLGKPDGLEDGYFVRPTVFGDVSNDMTIAREEIFGPVLVLIPYDSEAEAIAMANDTLYGLSAYVQSADPDRAMAVARDLRAGTVLINGAGLGQGSPFGGYKQSGNGREGGLHGIADFCEVKAIAGR